MHIMCSVGQETPETTPEGVEKVGMKPEISRDEGSEVCRCGCILAKHYANFVPGEPSCSRCRSCRGFVGTGRVDYTQLRSGTGERRSPGSEFSGETVEVPAGTLLLGRVTTPGIPWRWQLTYTGAGCERVVAINLTTENLRKLRDLLSRAVVAERGGP
jgi:hypothetical protein